MKNIILILIAVLGMISQTSAQMVVSKDDNHEVEAFTGVLANCYIPVNGPLQFKSSAQMRFGYDTEIRLTKNLQFNSWGYADINRNDPLVSAWFSYRVKRFVLNAGRPASAAAKHMRPLPNSFDGLFEFAPQEDNPGALPGIRVDYEISGDRTLSTGYDIRNGKGEVQIAGNLGKVKFASWYRNSLVWGASASADMGPLNLMSTINDGKTLSGSLICSMGNGFNYVFNSRFSLRDNESKYIETGFTKVIHTSNIHVLVGMTGRYWNSPEEPITRRVNTYIMISM